MEFPKNKKKKSKSKPLKNKKYDNSYEEIFTDPLNYNPGSSNYTYTSTKTKSSYKPNYEYHNEYQKNPNRHNGLTNFLVFASQLLT